MSEPAIAARPDPARAATPVPTVWVLAQLSPRFEVLATCTDRGRLVSEMAELYGHDFDRGINPDVRFVIRATNLLPA